MDSNRSDSRHPKGKPAYQENILKARRGANIPVHETIDKHVETELPDLMIEPRHLDAIEPFNGEMSASLSAFDASIRSTFLGLGLPLYYGGFVKGNPTIGYEYVSCDTPGAVTNYQLGRKFCALITTKFRGRMQEKWISWLALHPSDSDMPNCWKGHIAMPVEEAYKEGYDYNEVSLYSLMKKWV